MAENATPTLTKKGSGYAWAISGSGFLTQLICVWCLAMFGMNLSSFAESIGVTAASLAIVSSIFGLCYGGLGVVWGNLADRIGIRKELAIASIGAGVWLICFGQFANSIWTAAVFYGLTGAFIAGISSGVIPKIITSWYAASWRGKGIIFVSLGGSVAGILLGIIAPIIIKSSGWSGCFTTFGIICIILGIIVFLVVRDSPAVLGTIPFGADPKDYENVEPVKELTAEERAAQKAENHKKLIAVLKRPITWKYGIALIFWQFYLTSNSTYLVASITGAGYSLTVAGLVSSLQTAAMFASTFIFPTLSDKFGRKAIFMFLTAACAIIYVCFYFTLGLNNEMIVYGMVLLLGLFSQMTPIMQSSLGECFPKELRGTGPGMVTTITLVGRFFGPIICGAIIAATGNTSSSFLFAAFGLVVCCLLIGAWVPKTGGKYGDPIADEPVEL
jgi:sugar phosphate permease